MARQVLRPHKRPQQYKSRPRLLRLKGLYARRRAERAAAKAARELALADGRASFHALANAPGVVLVSRCPIWAAIDGMNGYAPYILTQTQALGLVAQGWNVEVY